jgi:hypothetical protein
MKLILLIIYFYTIAIIQCSLDNTNNFCDSTICTTEGGICFVNNLCLCRNCYITLKTQNDHRLCNYAQYSSMKAFILEFLFPLGIGHFYMGNNINGIIKLLITIFMHCGIYFCFTYFIIIFRTHVMNSFDYRSYNNPIVLNTIEQDVLTLKNIALFSNITFFIIHAIDLYWLLNANYRDGNNQNLC